MLKKFVEKFIPAWCTGNSPLATSSYVFHHVRSQTRHRTFSFIDCYTAYYRRAFM